MLESYNQPGERLYLKKDAAGDISVPCEHLAPHQVDGIRFLYNSYQKGKLGSIVNFPPGCGNSVQVAMFIGAVSQKLKRPVLILYDTECEKAAWVERFLKWTTITRDDIEIDAINTYLRKLIFIKNINDIGRCYSRNWGFLVVKGDSFSKVLHRFELKVDFKIWITVQDMEKDKEFLRLMCAWINPSDLLLLRYLDNDPPAVFKEDAKNRILVNLLLADILFTRRALKPFRIRKHKLAPETQQPVSKKNKDATGTKIKRSKNKEVTSKITIRIENVTSLREIINTVDTNVVSQNSPTSHDIDEPVESLNVFSKNSTTSLRDIDDPVESLNVFSRNSSSLLRDMDDPVESLNAFSRNSSTSLGDIDDSVESLNVLSKNSNVHVITNNDSCSNSFSINADNTDEIDEESKLDVETFIRDNDPLQSDINLLFLNNSDGAISEPSSPKAGSPESSLDFTSAVADIIETENVKPPDEPDFLSFKGKIPKNGDNFNDGNDEMKNPTLISKIDISEPVLQKVFFSSFQLNNPVTNQGIVEVKIEEESSEIDKNGDAEQSNKSEGVTCVKKESGYRFNSKMKETEDRALRKFKGSILDRLF